MHVLTLGDIKHDTFIELPDASLLCKKHSDSCTMCFSYGEKIPVGSFFSQIAGTAPNVAIGLTRLGHSAGVISSVGKDYDGDRALQFLREHRVDTSHVAQNGSQRLTHAVVLNYKRESTQLVAQNEISHRFPLRISPPDLLHISEMSDGYKKVYKDIRTYCKKHSIMLSMNPGVLQIQERSHELFALLQMCAVLFVNVREARLLTGFSASATPKKLLVSLQKLCPGTVVMTDGAQGAYAATEAQRFFAPPFPSLTKETTGAGDAFSSGFLGALLHNHTVSQALLWGVVNGASVVEYIGPTAGLLKKREILQRIAQQDSYRIQVL